jgi:hypothetical protein
MEPHSEMKDVAKECFLHRSRAICFVGGWPRLLTLPARPTAWVPRPFAVFAKGRVPRTFAVKAYAARFRNEISVQPTFTRTGTQSSKTGRKERDKARQTKRDKKTGATHPCSFFVGHLGSGIIRPGITRMLHEA